MGSREFSLSSHGPTRVSSITIIINAIKLIIIIIFSCVFYYYRSSVRVLSFNGDGQYVAMAGELQSTLYIVNSDTAQVLSKVDTKYPLLAMAWHPKHNLIALAPDDRGGPGSQQMAGQGQWGYQPPQPPQYMRLLTLPPLKG